MSNSDQKKKKVQTKKSLRARLGISLNRFRKPINRQSHLLSRLRWLFAVEEGNSPHRRKRLVPIPATRPARLILLVLTDRKMW